MSLVEKDPRNFTKISFLDKYMEGHKGYIAGGVFKNIFNDEKVKDVDIFFSCKEDLIEAIAVFREKYGKPLYENDNVICFYDKENHIKIELIRRTFMNPRDLLETFDFTITKFVYYKKETGNEIEYKIITHDEFFEHLMLKRLVIDSDLEFPINTFERSLRYAKYGYVMCKYSKIRLISNIHDSINNNPNTKLEDFLSKSLYSGLD